MEFFHLCIFMFLPDEISIGLQLDFDYNHGFNIQLKV